MKNKKTQQIGFIFNSILVIVNPKIEITNHIKNKNEIKI